MQNDGWPKTGHKKIAREIYAELRGDQIMNPLALNRGYDRERAMHSFLETHGGSSEAYGDYEGFEKYEVYLTFKDCVQMEALGFRIYKVVYRSEKTRLELSNSSFGYHEGQILTYKRLLKNTSVQACGKILWYISQGKIWVPKIPKPRRVVDKDTQNAHNRRKDRSAVRSPRKKKRT